MLEIGFFGWAVVAGILFVLPIWRICERVGLNPAISLLALIPVAGLPIALGMVAFKSWPNGESRVRGPFKEFERLQGER